MTTFDGKAKFSLHIEGGIEEGDSVPAVVLSQILINAQRSFDLIGVHIEGRTVRERARIPSATRSRFQLICKLPMPGCYAIPIELGGKDLLDEHIGRAMSVFKAIIEGITKHDAKHITDALPDEGLRHRLLESIRGMTPRADAKWSLKLWDAGDTEFGVLDIGSDEIIRSAIIPAAERATSQVVTGVLTNINFTDRVVTIIYPPTQRLMDCVYDEAVEELLIENRRGLIQVTGQVVLDDEGVPKKIIDVNDIRELDLSSIAVGQIRFNDLILKLKQGLTLEPTMDETNQLLCIVKDDLGIDVFAHTREELVAELNEQIAMLWVEYAQAGDDVLDIEAIKMKKALLAMFNEVSNDA